MKRGIIYGLIIAGILIAARWGCDRSIDHGISTPVLGPNDTAKIILDPRGHTVTTVQRSGTTRTYLPPRTTSVTVDAKGNVKFNARTYGTELSPFIGFAYSDKARLILGVGLLYYRNWEGALALTPSVSGTFSLRLALTVNYTVYNNTSLFIGVDHTRTPLCGIALKF